MQTEQPEDSELFGDVLNLEDQYYSEGYSLGIADGSRAGRIEGRIFGLEKGFEKFAEIGRIGGRASIWKARLPRSGSIADGVEGEVQVPPLSGSERLKRHVDRLVELTDPGTLPTENSEDDVADVDGAVRDAKAKATLIAKIVGEEGNASDGAAPSSLRDGQEAQSSRTGRTKRTGEMEDFIGLPNVRSAK